MKTLLVVRTKASGFQSTCGKANMGKGGITRAVVEGDSGKRRISKRIVRIVFVCIVFGITSLPLSGRMGPSLHIREVLQPKRLVAHLPLNFSSSRLQCPRCVCGMSENATEAGDSTKRSRSPAPKKRAHSADARVSSSNWKPLKDGLPKTVLEATPNILNPTRR